MGTLNVYKREGMQNDDLVWTLSGHQGTEWHEALVDIGGGCYQVRNEDYNYVKNVLRRTEFSQYKSLNVYQIWIWASWRTLV